MKQIEGYGWSTPSRFRSFIFVMAIAGIAGLMLSCSKPASQPKVAASRPSAIQVEVRGGGPIVVTTSKAEFQILASGFLQATLLKDGKRLTLDEPGVGSAAGSDYIVQQGNDLEFVPDFGAAKVLEATGKLGRGKRVEIPAHPLAPAGIAVERTMVMEVYDDFPNIALVSVAYKNVGTTDFQIDQVVTQQHRFNSNEVKAQPWEMWSFQGSSYDWGKDDVVKLTPAFSQPNVMGEMVKGGYGGGIPVVAFWTAPGGRSGWTRGDDSDGPLDSGAKVGIRWAGEYRSDDYAANITLKPGETLLHAAQFVSVFAAATFMSRCGSGRACCRKKDGTAEAVERSLQRELVRVGIRGRRDSGADAGHDSEAEGDGHQVGDAG
jgi:hypothetical protein